jgi:hypothetical protein
MKKMYRSQVSLVVGFLALALASQVTAQTTYGNFCNSTNNVGPQTKSTLRIRVLGGGKMFEVWDFKPNPNANITTQIQLTVGLQSQADAMGDGNISCGDFVVNGDAVAARLGREDDILHALRFYRNSEGLVTALSYIYWPLRDDKIDIRGVVNGDIYFIAGRKRDLLYRLCSNWKGDRAVWGFFNGRGASDWGSCEYAKFTNLLDYTRYVDYQRSAPQQQAARDQAARDQAARDQAARDQAARDQAARDQAARDQPPAPQPQPTPPRPPTPPITQPVTDPRPVIEPTGRCGFAGGGYIMTLRNYNTNSRVDVTYRVITRTSNFQTYTTERTVRLERGGSSYLGCTTDNSAGGSDYTFTILGWGIVN